MAVIRAEILALFAARFRIVSGDEGARRMWFDGVALNTRRHEFTKIKNT